ncbi:hypothetical protein HG535_0C02250 [Zygotorulaspora mrakii]|uniref:Uncharacterized protein n=1 Tax=Zygotorulaspora mrakii TaxID=42260 RepID=A0A7H9AZK0_ZYGMR|nr:uncharacterized protein HG535_0C02250 [Zygotorulaspora mrakii]QLG71875.1 hypothetical protein HG535_0C02250 [Zygotorulaspora mrakii]
MVKQRGTARAGKRYRYSSFKDKIDDLRIEPLRNLQKRVDDDSVESSHFLTSFEQWKERNLSAGFTKFGEEVDGMIQTLPQLIYHEEKILETLLKYIDKHEETSLQPLLDLLAQFCHDIGPDFLQFYEKVLISLIGLLDEAKILDSAEIFEWGFNCLAYIFKYLSKYLTKDLVPTFSLLFPLLSHSKEYISRFSAEALSFLIRKSSSKSLKCFVSYSFDRLQNEDSESFYEGLLTLFSESLLSTAEALHSKSRMILNILLNSVLEEGNTGTTADLFCDIWIRIANHASQGNLAPLYKDITAELALNLADEKHERIVHILSTLVFSESGRKVDSWSDIMSITTKLISQESSSINPHAIAFLLAALMRNCDVKHLTVYHRSFFEYFLAAHPDHFINFFKATLGFTTERLLTYNGSKYLQKYIDSHWATNGKKIALFLLDMQGTPSISNRFTISIPNKFREAALTSLGSLSSIVSHDTLLEMQWNIIILKHSSLLADPKISRVTSHLVRLFLAQKSFNDFEKDILGSLLEVTFFRTHEEFVGCVKAILDRLKSLQDSLFFVNGLNSLLSTVKGTSELEEIFRCRKVELCLSDNLLLPETKIRNGTFELLKTVFKFQNKEFPEVLKSSQIIEQIPLTLENARDITTRIRSIESQYYKYESDMIVNNILFKHLFGLLTVRFSPVWEGIYEVIPKMYSKDQGLVWELLMHTLRYPDETFTLNYPDQPMALDNNLVSWSSSISRFNDTIQLFSKGWEFCENIESSLLHLMKMRRGNGEVSAQLRSQVLKIMLLLPQLVERHSKDIVPFLFNEAELEEIFEGQEQEQVIFKSAATWTEADRNTLLKVIGKFKNIKAIYKSSEVHERFLVLLGSRNTEVQRLALDGLLAYRDPTIVKYRDNLKNLLDDTLFNDEITNMFTNSNSSIIQNDDDFILMPYVIRIFFGRAQTPNTSGVKKTRRNAVISSLPSFSDIYITQFLQLGYDKINYKYFFENGYKIEEGEFSLITMRRMLGFINILNSSLTVLGSRCSHVIVSTVRPLLYCIAMSYHDLNKQDKEAHMAKMVSNLRQQALKCLNTIFENSGDPSTLLEYLEEIYTVVMSPRIEKFESENLQQVSSIMKLISFWSTNPDMYPFLFCDNYSCPSAFMKLISNENTKDEVIGTVLVAANNIVLSPMNNDSYVELVTIIGASSLQHLPRLFQKLVNPEYVSIATELLLNLIKSGYVQDNETQRYLVTSLTSIVQDRFKGINKQEVVKVLKILSMLLGEYTCPWNDIEDLYKASAKLYQTYADRKIREQLNEVFRGFANNFPAMKKASDFINDLNSYSSSRMQEYDFPRMLTAFKSFIEKDYIEYTELEWLPVISNCLFFLNDPDEMAVRTNASHALFKLVDYVNVQAKEGPSQARLSLIQDGVLPHIRTGLRRYSEEIQSEYISVLAYIITNGKPFKELHDMQVLLFDGDEEANFFSNVNHIQLHRRLRAIRRLREFGKDLSGNSIAHYLLPIIEHYIFSGEEKYRNIGNEALLTVGALSNYMTWNQYKALFRRYISLLKSKTDNVKEVVGLIAQISFSLKNTMCSVKDTNEVLNGLRKFPTKSEEPRKFITNEILPTLSKILDIRDTETIVARIPLAEALVNLILGLKEEDTVSLLPGILTSLCQVLRSKSEELRDATRKSLAKITISLGSNYLSFIIKELTSALKRGSQIHVLSYTVHYVLTTLSETLNHSDLDTSASMLVKIIMEDIFGSAGLEKDSDNYSTKVKEVKVNKSYDTAEILASNVTLPVFGTLINPVRALLHERINLKSQNKLNELLRRFSLGLKKNSEGSSINALTLCHEIYLQSQNEQFRKAYVSSAKVDESKEFFLVNLNAKLSRVQNETTTLVNTTLQKFALDLLQAILVKHRQLLDVAYLEGFVPLLRESLDSDNEAVLSSAFKLLALFVKLDFSDDSESVFKNYARKVLNIIKESPSTVSELCQLGLKFLAAIIRHKDIKLKETALSYVLSRILPDLNEPNKQGLAFNFLKALVSKHIVLPELYDVLDTVKEIMVTNHSKEIRDVSRSVFYQFLMEYDQSRGRLEKQFKFMVDNLQYPSPEGRQSVMELINLITTKANSALITKLSSSLFVGLSNVAFNDDAFRCQEMATILLSNLLKKLNESDLDIIHKYIIAWLSQSHDVLFLSLGLRIFKIYVTSIGLGHNSTLDELALTRVKSIIGQTDSDSESQWELVYSALSLFAVYCRDSEIIYQESIKRTWSSVIDCLLYPHLWVRQAAARLASHLICNASKFKVPFSDEEIQRIAYKIMRQLSAPSISEELASTSVKTLVTICNYWKQNNTAYIQKNERSSFETAYTNPIDFVITKISAIIRSEENPIDSFMSKKSCIQLFALLIQMLNEEALNAEAEKIILPLYVYVEYDNSISLTNQQLELRTISQECLQILETKMSISDFTTAYANVKQNVMERRRQRKVKRSILAVTDPEAAAQRKLRKHARSRQTRKHEKDENGYYQRKNRKSRM